MGNPTEKNAGHNQHLQQVKGIVDDVEKEKVHNAKLIIKYQIKDRTIYPKGSLS
jgi:hypothetical protein